jgi:LacI family transcriptional regulator
VPGDVAVTGYDDTFVSAIRQVSLTSVNPDSSGIGSLAAQCVLRRIGEPGRPAQEHLLPPRLVIRSSSGAPLPRISLGGSDRGAASEPLESLRL